MKLDWFKVQTGLMLQDQAYCVVAVICALAIIGILFVRLFL